MRFSVFPKEAFLRMRKNLDESERERKGHGGYLAVQESRRRRGSAGVVYIHPITTEED